ncbi:MAG: TorF family putative porin [Pseudomonadales bacterium]|nr:TorF family putative porin [Pseudomonadales bacterium]
MNKSMSLNLKSLAPLTLAIAGLAVAAPSQADEFTANASITNNYIWRGLTQSLNEAAIQGGLDYSHDSGLYVGTWVSNVEYEAEDAFSYENDLYAGFASEINGFSYDIGYLYYNYDNNADFDFGEIYTNIGYGNLGLSFYLLANTEANAGAGQDFGFGEAFYASADYTFALPSETELGLHVGYHDGDFVDAFNGVTKGYVDYNVSIAKSGFAFMVTGTNLDSDDDDDGIEDFASMSARDNDKVKFVLSYSLDFDL